MRIIPSFPSRPIEQFGSAGFMHSRLALGVGGAVEWQAGEWHETRSVEPSVVLLVEGTFEAFA